MPHETAQFSIPELFLAEVKHHHGTTFRNLSLNSGILTGAKELVREKLYSPA